MSKANPRFHRVNPPLPANIGDVFMVTASGAIDNQQWYMNFGFTALTFALTANSESNVATSFCNGIGTPLRGVMAADCTLTAVKCQCVSTPVRQPVTITTNVNLGAGTVAGTHLPSTVAAVISKYTGFKGQHGRGRNYTAGVPTSFITPATSANLLNAGAITAFNTLTAALLVGITDGVRAVDLCVFTRVRAGQSVLNSATVNQLITRALLGTVRRRRIGRGK